MVASWRMWRVAVGIVVVAVHVAACSGAVRPAGPAPPSPGDAVEVVGDGRSVAGHMGPAGGRLAIGPTGPTLVVPGDVVGAEGLSMSMRLEEAATPPPRASGLGPMFFQTPSVVAPAGKGFEVTLGSSAVPAGCSTSHLALAYERPGDVGPADGEHAPALAWRSVPAQLHEGTLAARIDRLWGMHLQFVCGDGGATP